MSHPVPDHDSPKQGWIWRLRAQILLGLTLAPVLVAAIALPWGLIQMATAPSPDQQTTGTVVGSDHEGRASCVKVVEYTVEGRTYRTESNVDSSLNCGVRPGGDEIVHYESGDPARAYAGGITTHDEGLGLVYVGLVALAVAAVPGLALLLDYTVYRTRRRTRP